MGSEMCIRDRLLLLQQVGWASWLRRMHVVQSCQLVHADEHIALSEDGAVATVSSPVPPGSGTRTAASGTVLGHGQHFAVFTAQKTRVRNVLLVGVVAAGCDVRQLGNAEGVPGHCFFSTRYGRRYPNSGGGAWHGKQAVSYTHLTLPTICSV